MDLRIAQIQMAVSMTKQLIIPSISHCARSLGPFTSVASEALRRSAVHDEYTTIIHRPWLKTGKRACEQLPLVPSSLSLKCTFVSSIYQTVFWYYHCSQAVITYN